MIKYLLSLLLVLPLSVTCNDKLVENIYDHCQIQKYYLSNWWYECNEDEQDYKRILEAKIEVYIEIIQMIENIYDYDNFLRCIKDEE